MDCALNLCNYWVRTVRRLWVRIQNFWQWKRQRSGAERWSRPVSVHPAGVFVSRRRRRPVGVGHFPPGVVRICEVNAEHLQTENKQIHLQSIKTLKPFLSTDRNTSDQMIRMDNLLCLVWNCIFVEHTPGLKTLTHSFYLRKAFSIIKRNLIVLNESSSFIYAFQQTEEMMYLKTLPGWIKRAFLY